MDFSGEPCERRKNGTQILEMKRHLNKPDESYLCDVFKRGRDYVVLRYVNERPGQVGEITCEAGSTTYAYYRPESGYVLWKICGPDGRLKCYLFHICQDLKVAKDRVEYLDLLLDLLIDEDGRMTVLDWDEVEACAAKGIIGEQELAWIGRQKQEITDNLEQVIRDFDLLLRT